RELQDIIKEKKIDIIIPMEDETVEFIIDNIDHLSGVYSLLPSYKTFKIARDKAKTMKYAKMFDVPHPKTFTVNNSKELEGILPNITFPVIIKPRISSGSRGLIYVETKKELINQYT